MLFCFGVRLGIKGGTPSASHNKRHAAGAKAKPGLCGGCKHSGHCVNECPVTSECYRYAPASA